MVPPPQLPAIPSQFKPIQHFLKTASDFDSKDPVIAYWCRFHGVQAAMKVDSKSPDALAIILPLLDWLEKVKNSSKEDEAFTNDVVAQSHVEQYALKLFNWADGEDRASRFNKSMPHLDSTSSTFLSRFHDLHYRNVVKAFYTAGVIFDILPTIGVMSEDCIRMRKYAKWKAAYIHNCLKNGEMPQPGPLPEQGDEFSMGEDTESGGEGSAASMPPSGSSAQPPNTGFIHPGVNSSSSYPPPSSFSNPFPTQQPYPSAPTPPGSHVTPASFMPSSTHSLSVNSTGGQDVPRSTSPVPSSTELSGLRAIDGTPIPLDAMLLAQKFTKYALSALNYEDIPTAVQNMERALVILKSGGNPT
ncbi:unnamed protein product [Cyprideis torosa]|uniref:Uncharacterized protein n=1 Tax=Cyprideis torosa TaxID=163714 RepID=A0A7R8ZSW8_9CRUS|nr:unnamed protein product [Cyprideis torosa]CAG0902616.1 unnamed protein product [Cyprideis torosa]